MKLRYIFLPLFIAAFLFMLSCEEEKVEPPDDKTEEGNGQVNMSQLNQAFYNLMNE